MTDIASAENWDGGSAKALANVGARGGGFFGKLGVGTVNVQAHASDHGAGDALASALTVLAAGGSHGSAGIGAVTDIASAKNSGGGTAKALAKVAARASGGDLAELNLGKIAVQALASDHGAGDAVASALADIRVIGGSFGAADLHLGYLTDIASARNWGGGSAKALANAAGTSPRTIGVAGDIVVAANAHDFSGAAATANAGLALTKGGFPSGVVSVGGDISVIAHATDDADGAARARAAVNVIGSEGALPSFSVHVALGNVRVEAVAEEQGAGLASAAALTDIEARTPSLPGVPPDFGDVTIGSLTDKASAVSLGGGTAEALANVGLQATAALKVGGAIDVEALASAQGHGNAVASALLNIHDGQPFPTGSVQLGALTDKAGARASGGAAKAGADASLNAAGPLHVGDIVVAADASGFDGTSSHGSVTANANLTLHRELGGAAGSLTAGNISVIALGSNSGSGAVKVAGRVGVAGSSVSLGNVLIDVIALNKNSHGAGASANASFQTSPATFGRLDIADINLQALASSAGRGGARAAAVAGFIGGGIQDGGGVSLGGATIDARAIAGSDAHSNASALARLSVSVGSALGGVVARGPIDVEAHANDRGAGNAVASAVTDLSATGSAMPVSIASLEDVASAVDSGPGIARALAQGQLRSISFPPGQVSITGNVVVDAQAQDLGSAKAKAGGGASADAVLDLGSHVGLVAIGGNISVIGRATDSGDGGAKARAVLDLGTASSIRAGNLLIDARATELGTGAASASALTDIRAHPSIFFPGNLAIGAMTERASASNLSDGPVKALANATLEASGALKAGGPIDVEALASGQGRGNALASALLNIHDSQSFPTGSIQLGALTDRAGAYVGGGAARSLADVTVETPGLIRIAGPVDVSAGADNVGKGPAAGSIAASANADLTLIAGAMAGQQGLLAGDITLIARGTNSGSGGVRAGGRVNAQGHGGLGLSDVLIEATALNARKKGTKGAAADASLDAVGFGGALTLNSANIQALADSQGTGGAHAIALGTLREGGSAPMAPRILVAGGIAIDAAAITGRHAHSNASALASLAMFAGGSGGGVSLTVQGPIALAAGASDRGAGNAVASALGGLRASGSAAALSLGSLSDVASALNRGSGAAKARADVSVIDASLPAGPIHVAGNMTLLADAVNLGGGPVGSGAIGASADADLAFGPDGGRATLVVDGDIAIGAHATNSGTGGVTAAGRLSLGALDSVQLHNVTIDVTANGGRHGGGPGAEADASFLATGPGHPPIPASNGLNDFHLLSLDLVADAGSQGSGGAVAHAIGRMTEGSISIPGDITIDATAVTGRHGLGNASALASLGLIASSGRVTVGGPIQVAALAIDQGGGGGVAAALQDISAGAGTLLAHSIRLGPLSDKASAMNEGAGAAKAKALTLIDTDIEIAVQGSIDVSAIAMDGRGGAGASADAGLSMNVTGAGLPIFRGPVVNGDVSVLAEGVNSGSGAAVARTAFDIAGINVSLGDVLIDASALNIGKRGDGATASADLKGAAFQTFAVNSLNIQALASSHGIGGARAAAIAAMLDAAESGIGGFDIPGGITLDATGLTFSRAQRNASALASLAMAGLPGTGIKTGPIDVEALASDRGAGHALAAALAALDFSSGIDIESLTVEAREVDR